MTQIIHPLKWQTYYHHQKHLLSASLCMALGCGKLSDYTKRDKSLTEVSILKRMSCINKKYCFIFGQESLKVIFYIEIRVLCEI